MLMTGTVLISVTGHVVIVDVCNYLHLLPILCLLPPASTSAGHGSYLVNSYKSSFLKGLGHL